MILKRIHIFFTGCLVILFSSCIKDAPLNPEADILEFSFPENTLSNSAEISNDYIVNYPKATIKLQDYPFSIKVTEGATWEKIDKTGAVNDTLFFIKVTSPSKEYSKTYSILQVRDFSNTYTFELWNAPTKYKFENPKDGDTQWYSSNNGVAIAWSSFSKPAEEYPVRKTTDKVQGDYAVEIVTMVGPGSVGGGVNYIPCIAGSLYLGGFNALTGLKEPLRSTMFGVPFNSGKPIKLTGYYKYKEGTDNYINSDGTTDATKRDNCDIYAVLFKTDANAKYLYGDNVGTSDRIIAKAKLDKESIIQSDEFTPFDLAFDYDSYLIPFNLDELKNNEYKLTLVFTSSTRGAYYEGRPGSRLVVDNVELVCE